MTDVALHGIITVERSRRSNDELGVLDAPVIDKQPVTLRERELSRSRLGAAS